MLKSDKQALDANSAKSVVLFDFKSPPNAPKGIRFAATINIPKINSNIILLLFYSKY